MAQFLACNNVLEKKYHKYNSPIWLLWNQNSKTCILHKPAN